MPSPRVRPTAIVCVVLLGSGCLNNPDKPRGGLDDAAIASADGAADTTGVRLDTAAAPDLLAFDVPPAPLVDMGPISSAPDTGGSPVEPPPDAAGPDGAPDAPPDGAGCTSVCTAGHRRCGAGGGVEACATSAAGCLAWGPEIACGANQRCADDTTNASCVCRAPAAPCTAEGNYCRDAVTVGTCGRDSDGCLAPLAATVTCPVGQSCGGALPGAACACGASCTAAQVGTYCVDGKTVATCAGANGCYASSNPTTCAGARTCQGTPGASTCQCPAAGATAGAGCATVGATACAGNAVLTCTADGSGCQVWTTTSDCSTAAGGPFTCGASGGAAACQCPDPSPTEIFVDPAAGSDGPGGVAANGAMTPPGCRFRTLTRALAAVTTTRKKISAISAQPPVTFSAETFPLTVPPDATLGTADTTPAPASYRILFNSASATSAVVLGAGATLEGYIIQQASAGNSAVSAISCTAGAVSIRSAQLIGGAANAASKPAIGIAIGKAAADTCTGTIANVEVQAFRTGISVITAATAPLVIASATLRDSGTGSSGAALTIGAGRVTANQLTIDRSASGTASFGVVLAAVTSGTTTVLAATDLRVARTSLAGLELRQASGMALPSATLTGGDIQAGAAAEVGVRASAGTLSLTGTRIHDAGNDGLRVAGGTVTIGAGTTIDDNGRDGVRVDSGSLTGTGFTATSNTGDAVTVNGGVVVLHRVTLSDNVGRGLLQGGGSVLIDDGSLIRRNGLTDPLNPRVGIRMNGGTLTVGGAAGDRVEIADNGTEGIKLIPLSSATVAITRTLIHGSRTDGLEVDLAVAGSTVTVKDVDIYRNNEGVRVRRAAAAAGAGGVTLENVRVYENGPAGGGGVGVALRGDLGSVVAVIKDSVIRNNRDHGLLVQQGAAFVTSASIDGNEIHGNNTGAARSAGGVYFASASTLASFTGNEVYGNGGDEIAFAAAPNGGDTWTLGGGLACPAAPNQIFCYGTAGQVGVRILASAPAATKVDATQISWSNAAALRGREFDFTDGHGHDVSAATLCPAVISVCN